MNTHENSAMMIELREFERLDALFRETVDDFAQILVKPLESAFRDRLDDYRSNTTLTIATSIAKEIAAIVDTFTDLSDLDGDERRIGLDLFTKSLQRHISTTTVGISEQAITYEVRTGSRTLAGLVLSRWFELLAEQDTGGSEGAALNAHLLPNCMTVAETFAEIDLDYYGIYASEVAKALQVYWQSRVASDGDNTASFGNRFFIVPTADKGMPFRLFQDAGLAATFARTLRQTPVGIGESIAKEQYEDAYYIVRNALAKPGTSIPAEDLPALDALATYLRLRHDSDDDPWVQESSRERAGVNAHHLLQRPEQWRVGTRSIGTALSSAFDWCCDQTLSLLSVPRDDAMNAIRERRDQIMPQLRTYCRGERLRLDAVSEALALGTALYAETRFFAGHGRALRKDEVIRAARSISARLPLGRDARPRAKLNLTLDTLASVAQRVQPWTGTAN